MSKGTVKDWVGLLKIRDEQLKGFVHRNQQEKYILALGIRITELAFDAVLLIESRRISCVPIILRSALDSYADMRCCIIDETHPNSMTKAQYYRFYEMYNYSGNPLAEKYKVKGKKLTVWDRFKKSDLTHLYNGYYSMLSMYSHGNIGAIVETNVKDESIIIGSNFDDERALQYFDQAIYFVALTMKDVFEFFNFDSKLIEYLNEIIDKLSYDL